MDGEIRWRPPPILWIPVLLCGGLLVYVDISQLRSYHPPSSSIVHFYHKKQVQSNRLQGFFIKTKGCRIPEMDPYDPSIKEYLDEEEEERVICNNGTPPLMSSNLTSIYLIPSSLAAYGISDLAYLKCCYNYFWRVVPDYGDLDDRYQFSEKCIQFNRSDTIHYEYIRVTCIYNATLVYKDFFAFVPISKKTILNHSKVKEKPLNVLILGVDSISRLNFHRQMPKTARALENIGAIEFFGFNKVGDNTFPNLIPVLTGLFEEELIQKCWYSWRSHFDTCPFIWKHYKRKGYVTAYAEDAAWMGLFNYMKMGFKRQPTDYYWGVFNHASEKAIGNEHRLNVDQCVGSREVYKTLLHHIHKFLETMELHKLPYFGFFWEVSLSHDVLSKPKWGDNDYATLLETFFNSGALKNTVLVFMSDHGIRWGGIRTTFQGMTEEKLPILYIALPKILTENYPHLPGNLKTNSRNLVTPFDIHETLMDLLNPHNLTQENIRARSQAATNQRSWSLFQPIPRNRTCASAGIASHWCTCQQSVDVKTDDVAVEEAANFTVNYINRLLENYVQCATLNLDQILNARRQIPSVDSEELQGKIYSQDYIIRLRTNPGGAVFEVTVRRHNLEKRNYTITGSISRITLYGKQSSCISDFHLKLYCYCRELF